MAHLPTLVIAGTQSGSGKTSLTLAMTRALARRGKSVQTFKVGPDFLDPTYLALASGRPCYNLDGWMAGRDHVRRLFECKTEDADVALVEGVMGLFDGADPETSEGSTAEIARWLDAPILLVVNVHGMARSLAAIVKGFTTLEADLGFAGIVANHCGSERHAAWLADSLRAAALPPLVGVLPREGFPGLASRHLGLITADEQFLPEALLDALANALEQHLSLESLLPGVFEKQAEKTNRQGLKGGFDAPVKSQEPAAGAIPAMSSCEFVKSGNSKNNRNGRKSSLAEGTGAGEGAKRAPGRTAAKGGSARIRIGAARDAAFHFYYQALFDALERAGCETLFFSPLSDRRLPEGISGLYFGGGYPEAHAAALAANGEMLFAVREHAATGRPLYAECGGLMYLSEGLLADDHFHPFLGILPARTRMLKTKRALGYVEVVLGEDSLWGHRGDLFRGHEFHYSELVGNPAADPAWRTIYALRRRRSAVVEAEGFQKGAILASYTHLYYASQPAAVDHFIARCGGTP